jgi:hypothetical protein
MTAYVVEYGFGYGRTAFTGANPPTADPEQFHETYVRGPALAKARQWLARFPIAHPHVWDALARLAPQECVDACRRRVAGDRRPPPGSRVAIGCWRGVMSQIPWRAESLSR